MPHRPFFDGDRSNNYLDLQSNLYSFPFNFIAVSIYAKKAITATNVKPNVFVQLKNATT